MFFPVSEFFTKIFYCSFGELTSYHMRILLFSLFFFILSTGLINAQDTLVLINGKTILVRSVDLKDYTIAYRKMDPKSKLKTIDPERIFQFVTGMEVSVLSTQPTPLIRSILNPKKCGCSSKVNRMPTNILRAT